MDFTDLGKRFTVTGPKATFTANMNSVIDNPHLVSVEKLTIVDTDLKTIVSLPESEEIHINYNSELITLGEIHHNTQYFYCENNSKLTKIEDFSVNEISDYTIISDLNTFVCNNNKLTHLPYFPDNVYRIEAMNNNIEYFPDLPPGVRILYLSGNPFTKNLTELRKMVEYIFEHNCESDIEDIIDLKTYLSMKLATKKGTIRVGNKELPNELYKELIKYSLAGNKTKRKLKKKKKTEKKKKKLKKKPRKKSN